MGQMAVILRVGVLLLLLVDQSAAQDTEYEVINYDGSKCRVNVYFAIDTSETVAAAQYTWGSTVQELIEFLRVFVERLQQTKNIQWAFGGLHFSSYVEVFSPIVTDVSTFVNKARGIRYIGRGTFIDCALRNVTAQVRARPQEKPNLQYAVVLTDGHITGSPCGGVQEAADAAKAEGIKIFTVATTYDKMEDELRIIASSPLEVYRKNYLAVPVAQRDIAISNITHAMVKEAGFVCQKPMCEEEKGPIGPKGQKGLKGARGNAGGKGDSGQPGPPGEPGIEGPIGSTGFKGDPGTKGDKGGKGSSGFKGQHGLPGINGIDGIKGNPGKPGKTGNKGDQGTTGSHGLPGDTGIKGAEGLSGEKGDSGQAGRPGPQGLPGETGEKGVRGYDGDPGQPGTKGEKGKTGSGGSSGDTGPRGDPGRPGSRGLKGVMGEKGDMGPEGERGPSGPSGNKGMAGLPGFPGTRGPGGPRGDRGLKGVQGDPGVFGPRGETGQTGQKGEPGKNGSSIAGPRGSRGDSGFPGFPGQRGYRGYYGDKGAPGKKGDTGEPGKPGLDGTPGDRGGPGPRGLPGPPAPGHLIDISDCEIMSYIREACGCCDCEKICPIFDLVFVIDSSESIGEYNYTIAKNFVIGVTDRLGKITKGVSDLSGTRLGVVQYSHLGAVEVIRMDDRRISSISSFKSKVKDMEWIAGGTWTISALKYTYEQFLMLGRQTKMAVVVITDGQYDPKDFGDLGTLCNVMDVYAVGIGKEISRDNLKKLACNREERVMSLSAHAELMAEQFVEKVENHLCPEPVVVCPDLDCPSDWTVAPLSQRPVDLLFFMNGSENQGFNSFIRQLAQEIPLAATEDDTRGARFAVIQFGDDRDMKVLQDFTHNQTILSSLVFETLRSKTSSMLGSAILYAVNNLVKRSSRFRGVRQDAELSFVFITNGPINDFRLAEAVSGMRNVNAVSTGIAVNPEADHQQLLKFVFNDKSLILHLNNYMELSNIGIIKRVARFLG